MVLILSMWLLQVQLPSGSLEGNKNHFVTVQYPHSYESKCIPKRLAEYSLLNSISYSPGLLVFYQNLLYNGKANKIERR